MKSILLWTEIWATKLFVQCGTTSVKLLMRVGYFTKSRSVSYPRPCVTHVMERARTHCTHYNSTHKDLQSPAYLANASQEWDSCGSLRIPYIGYTGTSGAFVKASWFVYLLQNGCSRFPLTTPASEMIMTMGYFRWFGDNTMPFTIYRASLSGHHLSLDQPKLTAASPTLHHNL